MYQRQLSRTSAVTTQPFEELQSAVHFGRNPNTEISRCDGRWRNKGKKRRVIEGFASTIVGIALTIVTFLLKLITILTSV